MRLQRRRFFCKGMTFGAALLVLSVASLTAVSQQPAESPESVIRKLFEQSDAATKDVQKKRISEGPCTGLLEAFPEQFVLIPRDSLNALQRIDPAAWKGAVNRAQQDLAKVREDQAKAEESIKSENEILKKIREDQTDACFDWLLRQYGSTVSGPSKFTIHDRDIWITPTLFGTFLIDKPSLITPVAEEPLVRVIFKPAVFADERLSADIELAPSFPTAAVSGITLVPQSVTGTAQDHPFKDGQSERIDPKKPLEWQWRLQAVKDFSKSDVEIKMNAVRVQGGRATHPPVNAAHFMVKVERRPDGPSVLERNAGWVVSIVMGLIAGSVAIWGVYKNHQFAMLRDSMNKPTGPPLEK